jgi:hypothetical protein
MNRLGSYTANPSLTCYRLLKRILRYLAGTCNYGITYRRSQTPHMPILGFADAVFTNADDKMSTTRLVFLIGGGAVLWKSKRQTLSTLSTTEAEFIALAYAGVKARWFRNLFTELKFPYKGTLLIRGDNNGSTSMSNNPYTSQKSRHIDLKWNLIRQLVTQNIVQVEICQDIDQMADILTKSIPHLKHKKHMSEMGLEPV